MSNHYHLIITTPNEDIDKFMYELNKSISLLVRLESSRINQIFGGRYKWSIIDNRSYLYNVLRYVYQNPVRAGLAKRCEHYPYSSLLVDQITEVKLFTQVFNEAEDVKLINWFNQLIGKSETVHVKRSLMRMGICKTSKDGNNRPIMFDSYI